MTFEEFMDAITIVEETSDLFAVRQGYREFSITFKAGHRFGIDAFAAKDKTLLEGAKEYHAGQLYELLRREFA